MVKLILPFLILTFASCSLLSDDTGINTIIKESSNTIHSKKAFLFLKEAGATVSDSYQVTITDNSPILSNSEVGNAFTVGTNHSDSRLDKTSINFTWLGDSILQIDYDKRLRVFIQEKKVNGVAIIYLAR
jgi:hypothetical protein